MLDYFTDGDASDAHAQKGDRRQADEPAAGKSRTAATSAEVQRVLKPQQVQGFWRLLIREQLPVI